MAGLAESAGVIVGAGEPSSMPFSVKTSRDLPPPGARRDIFREGGSRDAGKARGGGPRPWRVLGRARRLEAGRKRTSADGRFTADPTRRGSNVGAKRGAYALPVKGNQPGLSAAIERALASRARRGCLPRAFGERAARLRRRPQRRAHPAARRRARAHRLGDPVLCRQSQRGARAARSHARAKRKEPALTPGTGSRSTPGTGSRSTPGTGWRGQGWMTPGHWLARSGMDDARAPHGAGGPERGGARRRVRFVAESKG